MEGDEASTYWDENWEMISKQIKDRYIVNSYKECVKQEQVKARSEQVEGIIVSLRNLSGDGLDGETMQYILKQVCMEEQMSKQLGESTKHAINSIFNKIMENGCEAWEDNMEETKSVIPTEDFRGIKYNGWLQDLTELKNKL